MEVETFNIVFQAQTGEYRYPLICFTKKQKVFLARYESE